LDISYFVAVGYDLMQNVPKTTRSIFSIIRKTLKYPIFNQFDASALVL